jgi:hypothetical protein
VTAWPEPAGRLNGRTLLLSASVPSPARAEAFLRIPDSAFEIEQAVISLARTVFSEGGRLAFGGHPSISPLVAMVAGEYRAAGSDPKREPPVVIYRSHAFDGYVPRDTMMMFEAGLAREVWVDAVDGEKFDPSGPRDSPPCPLSVLEMRVRMIKESHPQAMVCIGGMEGVLREAELFAQIGQGRPIFALARTGGAAGLLQGWSRDRAAAFEVTEIDREVLAGVAAKREGRGFAPAESDITPYPLVMEAIVDIVGRADPKG